MPASGIVQPPAEEIIFAVCRPNVPFSIRRIEDVAINVSEHRQRHRRGHRLFCEPGQHLFPIREVPHLGG
jgi:hypothetical protein